MMKKYVPIALIILVLLTFLGVKLFKKTNKPTSTEDLESAGARLVINQLDQDKRPFVVLSQHPSGKLLAYYMENNLNIEAATIDLEYLSGDLLKGARSSLQAPIEDPYSKAFLLGSCSAGGKCSFDKDLISGSLKLKLNIKGESDIHVLKGDYSFVDGKTTTTDGRLTYTPSDDSGGEILLNTIGLPEKPEGKVTLYPIAITSTGSQTIKGELEIKKSGVLKALIYTSSGYQELDAAIKDDTVSISLKHTPRKETIKITRDDLGGASEDHIFYVLGPIVLLGE